MEDVAVLSRYQFCYCCYARDYERRLREYTIKNDSLLAIFQETHIMLCFVCRRMAQHTDAFVQNVQNTQKIMQGMGFIMEPILHSARMSNRQSIYLSLNSEGLDVIRTKTDYEMEHVPHGFSTMTEGKAFKQEGNDEADSDSSSGNDDDEYVPPSEQGIEGESSQKERKDKKKSDKPVKRRRMFGEGTRCSRKVFRKPTSKIQMVTLTPEEHMQERANMANEKKYLDSLFKCADCVKGFMYRTTYEKHMEKHDVSSGQYICEICKVRMTTVEKLKQHQKFHEVRYKCMECGLMRKDVTTIQDHFRTHHAIGFHVDCPFMGCGKTFKRKATLRKHISYNHYNQQKASCKFCNKTYCNKESLKVHMFRDHTAELSEVAPRRPHVCETCGKGFTAPSILKKHMIKHSDRRDFYCVECNKSFKSMADLNFHLKTVAPHVQYKELPFMCEYCEKRFPIKRNLEFHVNNIHLNIRPNKCDQCDKAFVSTYTLNKHKKNVHEGYRRPPTHPCGLCTKIFNCKRNLTNHIRTHTGEKPFECVQCPARFSQSSILGTHVKLVHLKLTRDGRPKRDKQVQHTQIINSME